MHPKQHFYIILFALLVFGRIFASTDGIIGVFSPRLMYDGRPILWQNLDSDSAATFVSFFQGDRYNFFGLINGDDTSRVYAGLNTAGFGLVFSTFHGDSVEESQGDEAVLIKQALGMCGRLEDFDRLLKEATIPIGSNTSFACMDAFGEIKLYESGIKIIEPYDLKMSPDGFLVRANFHFYGPQKADDSFWRYHRAKQVIREEIQKRKLHNHIVVKKFARDLESIEFEPYPLPFAGSSDVGYGYIKCNSSISRFNTASCVVIHGVRAGENPDFATLWVIPGDPNCGVPIPLWPVTSEVPIECTKSVNSLNALFQAEKQNVYDVPSMPKFLNTEALVELRAILDPIENIIFVETRKALSRWRTQNDYLQDMIDFQMTTAAHVVESLSK